MFYLIHPTNSKNDIVWAKNSDEIPPTETSQYSKKVQTEKQTLHLLMAI